MKNHMFRLTVLLVTLFSSNGFAQDDELKISFAFTVSETNVGTLLKCAICAWDELIFEELNGQTIDDWGLVKNISEKTEVKRDFLISITKDKNKILLKGLTELHGKNCHLLY